MLTALDTITGTARRFAIVAALIGTTVVTGCSTTGSSSSNASLGDELTVSSTHGAVLATQEVENVDQIRPQHVIHRSKAHVTRTGEIYLMRGLANIFSRGIDRMADDMRARGYDASNFSYKFWQPIADDIVARARRDAVSYPIIIMGHSLGGNESSKFANYLGSRGVEVSLVVAFDPVETGHVGANIDRVVNYYLPKTNEDNRIHASAGFTGTIENIDVTTDTSITHTNVEKNARFQAASIKKLNDLTKAL
ncbi:MAG: hypothetical protein KDJ80_03545 [Nitratireductor sp.]|nr:hypothetical protein [Nitratireductor sp.]